MNDMLPSDLLYAQAEIVMQVQGIDVRKLSKDERDALALGVIIGGTAFYELLERGELVVDDAE